MTSMASPLLISSLLVLLSAPAWAQTTTPVVRIGGSSTVFPIMQRAIASYQGNRRNRDAVFDLKEMGTSGGFRQFCRGQLAVANASRPINVKELALCAKNKVGFVELPIAFDALTIAVNVANAAVDSISIKQLNTMWDRKAQAKITSWNQLDQAWPKRPLKLCGPGSDSGTYDYFNKVVNGDSENSRTDYTASEDDRVLVRCVTQDANAIGYFGYAYFAANRASLKALSVLGAKGLVAPSLKSVQNETYVPLSRPLFVYVNDKIMRSQPQTRRFIAYTLQNGLGLVREAGYIPLSASTYRLVESKLYRHVLGTAFGGKLTPGMSLGAALQRSLEMIKKPEFR